MCLLLILSEGMTSLKLIIYLGKILLWLAGLLTLYTAYDYIKVLLNILR